MDKKSVPNQTPQKRGRPSKSAVAGEPSRAGNKGSRQVQSGSPTPLSEEKLNVAPPSPAATISENLVGAEQDEDCVSLEVEVSTAGRRKTCCHPSGSCEGPSWKLSATTGLFLGGAIQPCTIILKSGADLTDVITSFAKEESRVVTIKAAQGMLSEITLEHEGSSKCYMVSLGTYNLGLMQKEEWRHGAEPRAARAAQSMDGASPVVQEVGSGIGEQSAPHQTSSSSELRSESPLPVASANAIRAVPGRSRS
ncbi:hypothetical protein RJ641_018758 [Dillenia turbinata]|uniref:AT-hook motif nuclear-localized protein n=1 Tax=Dillenia turbinata TaxID=194707 RepID=A0AAN8UUW5_9MAGN